MIYMDYAATTPVDKRVLDAMRPYFDDLFGNPSSIHRIGQKAESAVELARETVAKVLNCQPDEVVFTSCGSESDNLALRGVSLARQKRNHARWLITSHVEHPAVSKTAQQLEQLFGFQIEWLDVDGYGMVHPEAVDNAICDETALVSVMYANNEIGTINPIEEIARVCRARGIPFHSDAVQAAAYLPVDVQSVGVDLLSLGAHKFYGPKGIGALYVRRGTAIEPSQTGGGQEFGLRAGTHNVPYIVGFAEALKITAEEREMRSALVKPLRDRIIGTVLEEIPDSQLTGHAEMRLPHHASFVFKDVDGNQLLTLLDAEGFACSSGSACKTGNPEPSEVMKSIGLSREWGLGSLRITLGIHTTSRDVEALLSILPSTIEKSRKLRK